MIDFGLGQSLLWQIIIQMLVSNYLLCQIVHLNLIFHSFYEIVFQSFVDLVYFLFNKFKLSKSAHTFVLFFILNEKNFLYVVLVQSFFLYFSVVLFSVEFFNFFGKNFDLSFQLCLILIDTCNIESFFHLLKLHCFFV